MQTIVHLPRQASGMQSPFQKRSETFPAQPNSVLLFREDSSSYLNPYTCRRLQYLNAPFQHLKGEPSSSPGIYANLVIRMNLHPLHAQKFPKCIHAKLLKGLNDTNVAYRFTSPTILEEGDVQRGT